jgi:hypothetical protein
MPRQTVDKWALFTSHVMRMHAEELLSVRDVELGKIVVLYHGHLFMFHTWPEPDFLNNMPIDYEEFRTWFLKYLDALIEEVEKARKAIEENRQLGEGLVQVIKQCLNNPNASFEVDAYDNEVVIKVRVRVGGRKLPVNPIVLPAK